MNNSRQVLVHLSDIHFRHNVHGTGFDIDEDLRDRLADDAEAVTRDLGAPAAILVSGDIAFAGKHDEYTMAREWLRHLCRRLRCEEHHVWVVPGNHDIDRGVITHSKILRKFHSDLRTDLYPDESLRQWAQDQAAGPVLLAPLDSYNTFAASYGCDVTLERPWWETDLQLNDGSVLRIRGVNSALISDADDHQGTARLFVGKRQAALGLSPNIANIVMCHHPSDWLLQADDIGRYFANRSSLQLFGHKHSQDVYQRDQSVVLTAGAVHPERREQQWEPRYNVLTVGVEGTTSQRALHVAVYGRVWHMGTTRFVPDAVANPKRFELRLPYWEPTTLEARPCEGGATVVAAGLNPPTRADAANTTSAMQMDATRRLTYRFLSLPFLARTEVAVKLGLHQPEDESLPELERYRRYFTRAQALDALPALWDEVEARYSDRAEANPFRRYIEGIR